MSDRANVDVSSDAFSETDQNLGLFAEKTAIVAVKDESPSTFG